MNKWKVFGIIFMTLFIIENLLLAFIFVIGDADMNREGECISICAENDYDSFHYEIYTQLCYCYEGREEVYNEFIP